MDMSGQTIGGLSFREPPYLKNHEGGLRRVGVEIEFGSVSAREAALQVRALFGGEIETEDEHRLHIRGTELGDFLSELDSQYVHRSGPAKLPALEDLQTRLRKILGDISSLVVPCEIVCPPVEIDHLPRLQDLVDALGGAGARGTSDNLFYAFGFQLNPEIASRETGYITAVLKAYLLMSDWLRAIIRLDITRQIIAFADPFPKDYAALVVDPDYWPDIERLIDDYLSYNDTRNRELDLLPLFSWLDPERVRERVRDIRVKARPAFHYRLPDANIGQSDWSLRLEWNRWCVVERLAADRERLDAMGQAYIANNNRIIGENWAIRSTEWLLT
ncbi:hypothetical protein GR183_00475 [Stappia sp. GBMRC 2046]|uniref:Amidoligase enzyme n=1 Tax=Stappia sediminis TaxID=2692190 RepID=A0A7X3LQS4_9HYPH|nr:amidoligase family protein [Stappia sediminis]MXN63364.1 hypothetical protein [Stappia sediminis]